ncbi:ankyrin repeat domain-containing protein [Donghicola sp. C2-DW-16]|uniref:Ankyrin repeat domain-containing protein n=1 Tax=Donghicola mangrovi TaxID=2729614 RepID=A0ABX2PBH0_9RHOB|nr:ankyrin repeat domain-containing protein [Donghicola mangrovi]NVO26815.1 ankyrin repeat domain-containing protein [Donghicola mangrovi]
MLEAINELDQALSEIFTDEIFDPVQYSQKWFRGSDERIARLAVKFSRISFGERSLEYGMHLTLLAGILQKEGKQTEAAEMLVEAVALFREFSLTEAEIVATLLGKGADPDRVIPETGTFTLLQAAHQGHTEIVATLLEKGADPDQIDPLEGTFPLLLAAQNGHAESVAALLAKGADPDQIDPLEGTFPLLLAAQNGHAESVAALLEMGADPDRVNPENGTFSLLEAAQQGHAEIVAALLEMGADPDHVNPENGTFPLLEAAYNGHVDIVVALLEKGVDPDRVNPNNGTFPLLLATQNGHVESVAALLEKGADPDQMDPKAGTFPLLLAARNGHVEAAIHLLEAGCNFDRTLPSGLSSLGAAVMCQQAQMAQLLLNCGSSREGLIEWLQLQLDELLSGAIPPAIEQEEKNEAQGPELPPTILPGDWSATGDDKLQRLALILQQLGISREQFRGMLRANSLPNVARTGADLHASASAISGGASLLAVEFLWLDPGGKFSPAILFPGCKFEDMLADLLDPPIVARLVPDDVAMLVRMALMLAEDPGYPVTDLEAFRTHNKEVLERSSFPENYWSNDRIARDGMAYLAELTIQRGDRLLRVSHRITLVPFSLGPTLREEVIARGLAPMAGFAHDGQRYLPYRVLGTLDQ